jgi:hypothetical protein
LCCVNVCVQCKRYRKGRNITATSEITGNITTTRRIRPDIRSISRNYRSITRLNR